MKMTLRDFFKKGELWSGLEDTIISIKKSLTQHAKGIEKRRSNEVILMQHIKQLKQDNVELRQRLEKVEDKFWKLHVVSNTEELSIIQLNNSIKNEIPLKRIKPKTIQAPVTNASADCGLDYSVKSEN